MYNHHKSGRKPSSNFRGGGFGNRFPRAARPQQSANRGRGQYINPSSFVKHAEPILEIKQVEPTHQFNDFAIHDRVKQNIAQKGYIKPTAIQDQSIEHVLAGKDVLGLANTGTGKTASFLIPLIDKVFKDKTERVLIIAPTRELALQIRDELRSFSPSLGIYSALCIGGTSMGNQIYEVKRNPQFIIGTPGRLKDLIQQRVLRLDTFRTVVLDEVDRMLDMGFVKDIQYLISLLPEKRQTLLYSATINQDIERIIQTILKDPIKVAVKTQETAANVDQDVVHFSSPDDKLAILHEMLQQPEFAKVIIFGRTKFGVEKLSRKLFKSGHRTVAIHGNKTQSQRQSALRAFRENSANVLIATDVAARGLDIPDVTHVINFDQPATYDDYVHRIGRTGRANSAGKALTFVEKHGSGTSQNRS
ncbi:MAG: hypothetical protein RI947_1206 [Candidatus Parcubacteria bacterium]|jgi:superfamily II DNA/RNA helicase